MSCEQIIRLNRLFVFCFAFSTAALLVSFFAEFIWKIKPCALCKWERLALLTSLIIAFMGFWTQKKQVVCQLLRLAFVALSVVAGYHILILNEFVSDPCAVAQVKTINDFKTLLDTRSCGVSTWNMFGLPASTYSLFFGVLFTFACSRRAKEPVATES